MFKPKADVGQTCVFSLTRMGLCPYNRYRDVLWGCGYEKAASAFPPIPVHISHIGIFPGGQVLFGAPERSAALTALHDACDSGAAQSYPWTPHATILIDKPETVCAAVPVLVRSFTPFVGKIIRLHLCAFWPTREIAAMPLTGKQ